MAKKRKATESSFTNDTSVKEIKDAKTVEQIESNKKEAAKAAAKQAEDAPKATKVEPKAEKTSKKPEAPKKEDLKTAILKELLPAVRTLIMYKDDQIRREGAINDLHNTIVRYDVETKKS